MDLAVFRLSESTAPGVSANGYLVAADIQLGRSATGRVDLHAVYNRESKGIPTDQVTVGFRWGADGESLRHHAEAYYQTGDRAGEDVSAYMLGAGAGVSTRTERISLSCWYDHLSGDDDPSDGKIRMFDTLFTTNHAFYGHADVFTNLPLHTGGRGLQDLAARLSIKPVRGLSLSVDAHAFFAVRKAGSDSRRLGEELDFAVRLPVRSGATIKAGLSYFYAADALADAGRLRHDIRFGYLLADVSF